MDAAAWYLATGLILIAMALTSSLLSRMPLSASMLCLVVGVVLGPYGVGMLRLDFARNAGLLERLTEVGVIVSLFTAGLQLRLPLMRPEWWASLRLASLGMVITVALITGLGLWLGLPLGAAIILGAVLAPTDPVLASDVQVKDAMDSEPLRFVLTGEAGLNDGTAFPFVMLGLGLLGLHEIGDAAWRWWSVDLVWAVVAGLAIGAAAGTAIGKLVLYLRAQHREALGLDNFLAVGLIALSYGVSIAVMAYGFLAVFAAGVALRRIERQSGGQTPDESLRELAATGAGSEIATAPHTAPVYMAEAVLQFNSNLERFAEVVLVIVLGALLRVELLSVHLAGLVLVVLLIIRPAAAYFSLIGSNMSPLQRRYIAWFGIRGIGSLYYLSYALGHGLRGPEVETLINITLATVAVSIVAHGVSVTPLMNYYGRVKAA
jgi:NhaP-type Na+/H+ or K+/H+ antiporter